MRQKLRIELNFVLNVGLSECSRLPRKVVMQITPTRIRMPSMEAFNDRKILFSKNGTGDIQHFATGFERAPQRRQEL